MTVVYSDTTPCGFHTFSESIPMKLIGSLTSPYTRKVRIVLAEKKIDAEFLVDIPWSPTTSVPQYNPLGKVPVLVLDDGSTLFDSRVIVEYLDNAAPNNRLFKTPHRERIAIKRWEALADGVADAAAAIVFEGRRPENERSASWVARQHGKVLAGLAALSADLGERAFCHGNSFTLADIAVGATLGFLDFRFPQIDWRVSHPNLAALYEKLAARPSFIATVPRE